MQIIGNNLCPKHHIQAHILCTKAQCYSQKDILVCPECSSRHAGHHYDLISTSLLNDKVHELMKQKMDFEESYQKHCDALITQFKKFKLFKQDIMNVLNHRQRCLNDLCRKIKRNIPYEVDKHLFKKNLNYIYLSTRCINPNRDLYISFQKHLIETINECRKCIHRFEVNSLEIAPLLKKDNYVLALLKKTHENSINQVVYTMPIWKSFKFKKPLSKVYDQYEEDSKLFRLSNEEFVSFSRISKAVRWHSSNSFGLSKSLPVPSPVQNFTIMGRYGFMTTKDGGILLYDMLGQKLFKEFASPKHQNAQITNLLPLDNRSVLNFITCPNQIVCLQYHEDNQNLKLLKGVETRSRSIHSQLFDNTFVSCYDDKIMRFYHTQHMEKKTEIEFDHLMKSIGKVDNNSFIVGGESNSLYYIDTRIKGITSQLRVPEYINNIKKIFPSSVVVSSGKSMRILELRMQKELTRIDSEDVFKHMDVLNSEILVTSGKKLKLWQISSL